MKELALLSEVFVIFSVWEFILASLFLAGIDKKRGLFSSSKAMNTLKFFIFPKNIG